jgi:hypothetical protein
MNMDEIKARDAASGSLWFTGPESFTSLAARDRRDLLAEIDRLRSMLAFCSRSLTNKPPAAAGGLKTPRIES